VGNVKTRLCGMSYAAFETSPTQSPPAQRTYLGSEKAAVSSLLFFFWVRLAQPFEPSTRLLLPRKQTKRLFVPWVQTSLPGRPVPLPEPKALEEKLSWRAGGRDDRATRKRVECGFSAVRSDVSKTIVSCTSAFPFLLCVSRCVAR